MSYDQRFSLKYHKVAVHPALRPYACDICDKRYAMYSHIKMHMRIHIGEKHNTQMDVELDNLSSKISDNAMICELVSI